jgi:hypothetical protein
MNKTEKLMLDLLQKGRDEFGYIGVKAEFEAEGTRTEELLRLMEIARKAGLEVGLKIGGCEAVRDLIESKLFGVEYIIAPMIETPYALSKFVDATNKVYSKEEREYTSFLFNLETATAFQNRADLFALTEGSTGTDGVVFGRVDFTMSKGLSRSDIGSEIVTDCVLSVARDCKRANQELVVGGGISIDSLPILKEVASVHLTRFETRKIIFDKNALDLKPKKVRDAMLQAVHFELLWLKNKRDHYRMIEVEDEKRIEMLESRWQVLEKT